MSETPPRKDAGAIDEVLAGSEWIGANHGSRWMAFQSTRPDLVDMWCMDPGTSLYWRTGSIATMTPSGVRQWLLPARPAGAEPVNRAGTAS